MIGICGLLLFITVSASKMISLIPIVYLKNLYSQVKTEEKLLIWRMLNTWKTLLEILQENVISISLTLVLQSLD